MCYDSQPMSSPFSCLLPTPTSIYLKSELRIRFYGKTSLLLMRSPSHECNETSKEKKC